MEEVKYMKNGAEEEQKIAARNQENLVRMELLAEKTHFGDTIVIKSALHI